MRYTTLKQVVDLICGIGTVVAFYGEPYVYEIDGLDVCKSVVIVHMTRISDGLRTITQLSDLIAVYGSEYDIDTGMIYFFEKKKVKYRLSRRENLLSYCMSHVKPFSEVELG